MSDTPYINEQSIVKELHLKLPDGVFLDKSKYHVEAGFRVLESEELKDGTKLIKQAELVEISLCEN